MNNLSDRLAYALTITHTRKAELARRIKVKPQIIQFLCNSKTHSSRFTFDIANALGLNAQWLATGEGDMFADGKNSSQVKLAPLLSYHDAKDIFIHNKPLKELSITSSLPLRTEEETIFAIKIQDSAMHPTLPINSFLFYKPLIEPPKEKEVILVYSKQHDSLLIRSFLISEGVPYLAPNNKEFFKDISINQDIKIIGKGIGYLSLF